METTLLGGSSRKNVRRSASSTKDPTFRKGSSDYDPIEVELLNAAPLLSFVPYCNLVKEAKKILSFNSWNSRQ